jgi:hypothetical protein
MAISEDSKQKMFILMAKLNPTFKKREVLNEDEDKWIQGAVNPEHKGYCTPMTKPTCTPARKALAKRFKKGIDEEYSESTPEDLKIKAERVKAAIDELVSSNDEFGILRTLYRLLVERKKASGIPQPAITSEVAEVNAPQNDTYFETLSAALDAVREKVIKKGFTVDEDEMFRTFGTGGINYGETKRATISLLKNGVPDKRRSVTIAIYRMDSGKYELTAYLN